MSNITKTVTTLIDKGSHFEGKLAFEGMAQISGSFKGEIYSTDKLIIEEGANVVGQIEGNVVVIRGNFEGTVFAKDKVTMLPPAVFKGAVTSPSLKIEEGVVFEGASYVPRS